MNTHSSSKFLRCAIVMTSLLAATQAGAAEPTPGTLIIISSLGWWTLFGLIPWLALRIRKHILNRRS